MWSLHSAAESIGALAGAPADNVLYLLAIVLTYAEALIFNRLPDSETIKSAFSVVVTLLTIHELFDLEGALHLSSAVIYTWLLSKLMPGKTGALINFAAVMLHLSYNHLHRQVFIGKEDFKSFDHTAPFMVLAIKLTSYGFSVWDGTRPDSELTEYQKKKAIKEVPSLLSFAGYCFFFGGFLAGPAFEFADYRLFCAGKLSNKPITGVFWPMIRCVGYGIITLVAFLLLADYSYDSTKLPAFTQLSVLPKLLLFWVAGLQARTKFYTAWKLAEGACILTGLGWNGEVEVDDGKGGKRKKTLWNRVSNVHPSKIELTSGWAALTRNWNINTQSWLENHIYRRVVGPDMRPTGFSMIATYAVSAFWHGFYPGYYLFFFSAAITTSVANSVRRALRPFFLPPSPLAVYKPAYDVLTWFTTMIVLNYMAAAFMLLDFRSAIDAYASVHFIPHAAVFGLWFAFQAGLGRYAQHIQRKWGLLEDKKRTKTGEGAALAAEKAEKVSAMGKENGHSNGVTKRSSALRAD